MKRLLYILVLMFLASTLVFAKTFRPRQLRIAVIDTGLNLTDPRFQDHLCKTGHKDFTGEGIKDLVDHGTHVVGIIQQNAGNANYCLLIYKFYSFAVSGKLNQEREVMALKQAIKDKADIVNISGGGESKYNPEKEVIKHNPRTLFVVAAGNDHHDLDLKCDYYPACLGFNNILVIGSLNSEGVRSNFSNYGSVVSTYEIGEDVLSTLPDNREGRMSGTSMATAVYTGKLIRKMLNAE
jgi:subtilisin family serine protease